MIDIESILQQLRPEGAIPVPPELVLDSPLTPDGPYEPEHPFDRWLYEQVGCLKDIEGRVLVFDLDDTLVNTDYICGKEWNTFPEGLSSIPTHPSIDYRQLNHSVSFWLKAGWKRPVREQFSSARYPFLRNPPVEAQLRPGALALLHGLKEAGAVLVLATQSARQRVQFIMSRLPHLEQAFQGANGTSRIITAEDLASANMAIRREGTPALPKAFPENQTVVWESAGRIHRKHPSFHGLKTVMVLYRLLGLTRLDVLVDDSETAREFYFAENLQDRFIPMPRKEPCSRILAEMPALLAKRFSGKPFSALPGGESCLRDYPVVRFEDPLYFPLVHTSERFPETEGVTA